MDIILSALKIGDEISAKRKEIKIDNIEGKHLIAIKKKLEDDYDKHSFEKINLINLRIFLKEYQFKNDCKEVYHFINEYDRQIEIFNDGIQDHSLRKQHEKNKYIEKIQEYQKEISEENTSWKDYLENNISSLEAKIKRCDRCIVTLNSEINFHCGVIQGLAMHVWINLIDYINKNLVI